MNVVAEKYPHSVFVYGTLKSGRGNHALLRDAQFVGSAVSIHPFAMFDTGGFPVVFKDARHNVSGEVYKVNDAMLRRLDQLEGYPHMYTREQITVDVRDTGVIHTCWMYLGQPEHWNDAMKRLRPVPTDAAGVYRW